MLKSSFWTIAQKPDFVNKVRLIVYSEVMPRVRQDRDPHTWDANQVVAYNFKLAREVRGWTQEQTAERLEPFLGQRLKKTSISAIERSIDSERRRVFTAQEILGFSLAFSVSYLWFLVPPPDEDGEPRRRLEGYSGYLTDLLGVALGREHEVVAIGERIKALAAVNPEQTHEVAADSLDFGTDVSWKHFEAVRKDQLTDMVVSERDHIETIFDQMRELVAKFDEAETGFALAPGRPRRAYRNISQVVVGREVFGVIQTDRTLGRERSSLLSVVDRDEVPWEEIIDTEDPAVQDAIRNLAVALEPKAKKYLERISAERSWRMPFGRD